MVDEIPLMITAVYALAMLYTVVASVELSGFFPSTMRPEAFRSASGSVLINALLVMVLGIFAAAIWLAVTGLPWTVAVIVGGLAILLGPLVFQGIPQSVWESRLCAAVTVGFGVGLIALLYVANP